MSRHLPHIRARLARPLAITPDKLAEIEAVLAGPISPMGQRPQRQPNYYLAGNVAVIPIGGSLVKSTSGLFAESGLTSYANLAEGLRGALDDPQATSILLHIDSRGGEVDGLLPFHDQVAAVRGQKPITALVDEMAASAAYIIASAADRVILATPLATVGSIGVIAQHVDQSEADKAEGIKVTTLHIGARKADGSPHAPLSAEAKAVFMASLQNAFDEVAARVAKNRGLSVKAITAQEAAVYEGTAAIAAGLADSIETPETLLAAMQSGDHTKGKAAMALKDLNQPEPAASVSPGATLPTTGNLRFADNVPLTAEHVDFLVRSQIGGLGGGADQAERDKIERSLLRMIGKPSASVSRAFLEDAAIRQEFTEIRSQHSGGAFGRHATNDEPATYQDSVGEALFARFNPSHKLSGPAQQFVGMSLAQIAADCLQRAGGKGTSKSAGIVISAALQGTSDFPLLLSNFANKVLRAAYEAAPSGLKVLARESTAANFKDLHRLQAGEFPTLEKVNEHGEFKHGSFGEAGETYRVATYGKIVGLTRQAMINDDLASFNDMQRRIAFAVAEFEASQFADLINSNPLMSDGENVFDSAHGNLAGSGAAIGDTTLSAARRAMRDQKGVDGQVFINTAPKYLLVNSGRETEAEKAIAAITPNQVSDVNVFTTLTPVVDPRLTSSTNGGPWYLVGDPNVIDGLEYAYLDGQRGPRIETEQGFDYDGVRIKVALDFGAGWLDWRGWYKNPGNA